MNYRVATLRLIGDEGYPQYSNIENVEAVSEKQAIFFYNKKHNISYREIVSPSGRMGVIYKGQQSYYQQGEVTE